MNTEKNCQKTLIIKKNSTTSKELINGDRSHYLSSLKEKLISVFSNTQITETIIYHQPFTLGVSFKKDDEYPLISKDNELISCFTKIDIQALPRNPNKIPTIITQFFPDQSITLKDIHNKIEPILRESYQEILEITDSSILRTDETKLKLKKNVEGKLEEALSIIGCKLISITESSFGRTQEEYELRKVRGY